MGNLPKVHTSHLPERRYSFRFRKIHRATNRAGTRLNQWTVKSLADAIRDAQEGEISHVSADRSKDVRAQVWRFPGGLWVADIVSGANCSHDTAASRARSYGKDKVADAREEWEKAGLLMYLDGKKRPLMDLQRFGGIYSRLRLAVDSYESTTFQDGTYQPPRFGKLLCHCDDYAKYEICPMTCALERAESFQAEDKWEPSMKITKGADQAPEFLQSIRRDIRSPETTAAGQYAKDNAQRPYDEGGDVKGQVIAVTPSCDRPISLSLSLVFWFGAHARIVRLRRAQPCMRLRVNYN